MGSYDKWVTQCIACYARFQGFCLLWTQLFVHIMSLSDHWSFIFFFSTIIRADFLAFCSLWHLFLDIRGFWWQIKMVSQDCCFSFWQVGTWSILCLKRQPVAQTGHFKWPVDEYPRVANGVYCPAHCSNQCGNNFQLHFNLHSRVTDTVEKVANLKNYRKIKILFWCIKSDAKFQAIDRILSENKLSVYNGLQTQHRLFFSCAFPNGNSDR